MTVAEYKVLVRRLFEEGVNTKDVSVVEALISDPDLRFVMSYFIAAFDDLTVAVEALVAEGDLVCSRGVFSGTHREWFGGFEASGQRVEVPYMDMWRVEDGRLAQNWVEYDHRRLASASTAD